LRIISGTGVQQSGFIEGRSKLKAALAVLFQATHRRVVSTHGIEKPITPAKRRRRQDPHEDAISYREAANMNALNIAPGKAMLATVRRKNDAIVVANDSAREMEGEHAPRNDDGDGRRKRERECALGMEDEDGRERGDEVKIPPQRYFSAPRSKLAIFCTSASIPTPVRNESVRTTGLPWASPTSVVETTRS
jgi:hypothetical protein